MRSNQHPSLVKVTSVFSCTHPSAQEGQSWDDPLLGDALEDPGRTIQATHAGSQRGDVEAQQKEETHQGDLEEERKQTQAGRGWVGLGARNTYTQVQFRCIQPLVKTTRPGTGAAARCWWVVETRLTESDHFLTLYAMELNGEELNLCSSLPHSEPNPGPLTARARPRNQTTDHRVQNAGRKW